MRWCTTGARNGPVNTAVTGVIGSPTYLESLLDPLHKVLSVCCESVDGKYSARCSVEETDNRILAKCVVDWCIVCTLTEETPSAHIVFGYCILEIACEATIVSDQALKDRKQHPTYLVSPAMTLKSCPAIARMEPPFSSYGLNRDMACNSR